MKDSRGVSAKMSLEENAMQIGKSFEIKVGSSFILMNVARDPVNKFKTVLTLEPPYRFKNCLPKPLRLQIISANKYTTVDRKVYPNEVLEEFEYPLQKKTYIKI